MAFTPRDWREILVDKITYIVSNTPITSVNPGSVIATICEATSLEDSEQYYQMLEIVRNYSLNTTTGTDLDNRAEEYGLEREDAKFASTKVTISDSSITKTQTNIYAGFSGPLAGETIVYADKSDGFPSSGTVIIGRNKATVETISYSSITDFLNYVRFNLSSALQKDHGTDETIILSQGGNRVIPAGTKVKVVENDISESVIFSTLNDVTLLDGEEEIENVDVVADTAGSSGNVPAGLIAEFSSVLPFPSATVRNPQRVTNGRDEESDSELRDRIKLHIQSLSRGTKASILSSIIGLEDSETNTRVVSANLVETTEIGKPSICYIDDGTGFEPSYSGTGFETLVSNATGGESILQLDHYPMMKAFLVTKEEEPFFVNANILLTVEVGRATQTIIIQSPNGSESKYLTAEKVAQLINLFSPTNGELLIEARTTDNGKKVIIFAKENVNEDIRVVSEEMVGYPGVITLNFPTDEQQTLYLYKNYKELLNKDGEPANIESGNPANYSFTETKPSLLIKVDGKDNYQEVIFESTDTSALSVVNRINQQLQGATAELSGSDASLKVRILSNLGDGTDSKIKIGRDGSVTTPISSTVFRDSTLGTDFPYVDQIKNLRLLMTSGANIGNAQNISAYDPSTGAITLSSSIGVAPSIGDTFVIDGFANGNSGNPATATNKLNFSKTEIEGKNGDYVLNRTQGQLELQNSLNVGDIVTAGTPYSRAWVESGSNSPYVLGATTLLVSIDGNTNQTLTFTSGTYSVDQLITTINSQLVGGQAFVSPLNTNKIAIRTNSFENSSVKINGGTANSVLLFSTVLTESLKSNYAFIESGNTETSNSSSGFTFSDDSSLIIVIDEKIDSPFNLKMSYQGTVTFVSGTPTLSFADSGLSNKFFNDFYKNFFIKFKTATNAGNIDLIRVISAYVDSTGLVTLSSALPNSVTVGDTFVLIPKTTLNISNLFNSLIVSSFGQSGLAESSYGKNLILSTLSSGSTGAVNVTGGVANFLTSYFLVNGNASGQVVVSSIVGYMVGLEVSIHSSTQSTIYGFITSITGSGPHTLVIQTLREGGVNVNLSAYLVADNSYIRPRNLLNFSTEIKNGTNAYNFYTGLLQKVQWTIDGKEDDEENYPGVKAAGTQVEVKAPATYRVSVKVDITTSEGISLSSVQDDVKNAIDSYINNLGVSDDVIVSEIIDQVMGVDGVIDVQVKEPLANISIGDETIARASSNDIIVS